MEKRIKVIKADYLLKDKIGSGHIPPEVIEKCEDIVANTSFDFAPYAKDILDQLYTTIEQARNRNIPLESATEEMTSQVMQLKANAPMFKYILVGNLANIMLSFLESMDCIDGHALEIVSAHHKTLTTIIAKKMSGDCGDLGKQFETELRSACERYYKIKTTQA